MKTTTIILPLAAFAAGALLAKSKSNSAVGSMNEYPKLRAVRVIYDNGNVIETSMAAHLTDEEILNYFRIGRKFNVGSSERDVIASVTDVEILQ